MKWIVCRASGRFAIYDYDVRWVGGPLVVECNYADLNNIIITRLFLKRTAGTDLHVGANIYWV